MKNRITYRQRKRISDFQLILTFSVSVSLLGAVPLTPEKGETLNQHFGKLASSVERAKEDFLETLLERFMQETQLPQEENMGLNRD